MSSSRQPHRSVSGAAPGQPEMSYWATLFGLIWALALPSSLAAQAPGERAEAEGAAAMIVDTGDADPIYVVVAFDDPDMTAIDLMRVADLPLVTVSFGGLGEGVCTIFRTGCDVSECRQRLCQTGDPESSFWQFWNQDDAGEWALSALGGGAYQVENGDVVAWAWTGDDPQLPDLSWAEVALLADAPEEIVAGNASDSSGVWVNAPADVWQDDESPSITGTLLSTGVIVLLAGVGLFLIRRQRLRDVKVG